MAEPPRIETDIPQRLDRLPWGRFHTLVAVSLGITWVLDGLEVTIAGAIASALKASPSMHLTEAEIGLASSFYLAGAYAPQMKIPARSLLAAALGGLLMGVGARLATGCNIGAFFSGLASGSLHGLVWAIVAFGGVMLGARLRPWFGLSR